MLRVEDTWDEDFINFLLDLDMKKSYLYYAVADSKQGLYATLVASILTSLNLDAENRIMEFYKSFDPYVDVGPKKIPIDKAVERIQNIIISYKEYLLRKKIHSGSRTTMKSYLEAFENKEDIYFCVAPPFEVRDIKPDRMKNLLPRIYPISFRAFSAYIFPVLEVNILPLHHTYVSPFSCIANETTKVFNLSHYPIHLSKNENTHFNLLYAPYSQPISPGTYFPSRAVMHEFRSPEYDRFINALPVPLLKLFLWFYEFAYRYFDIDNPSYEKTRRYHPYHYPCDMPTAVRSNDLLDPINYGRYWRKNEEKIEREIEDSTYSEVERYVYPLPGAPSIKSNFYSWPNPSREKTKADLKKLMDRKWKEVSSDSKEVCKVNIRVLKQELAIRK